MISYISVSVFFFLLYGWAVAGNRSKYERNCESGVVRDK